MKPKTIQLYQCTNGTNVATLAEWKEMEVRHLIGEQPTGTSAAEIIQNADALIEILSVKDKGRPLNRKDSTKRKARTPSVVPDAGKAA